LTEPQRIGDGGKACAVDGGWAEAAERLQVAFRAIAHMLLETIARIIVRQRLHGAVAGDFGDDGGSGDCCISAIAADDGAGRRIQPRRHVTSINDEGDGGARQGVGRTTHPGKRGATDVQGRDVVCRHKDKRYGLALGHDAREEFVTTGRGELFRIIEAGDGPARIKKNGCHHQRAGQRATPGFINARHPLVQDERYRAGLAGGAHHARYLPTLWSCRQKKFCSPSHCQRPKEDIVIVRAKIGRTVIMALILALTGLVLPAPLAQASDDGAVKKLVGLVVERPQVMPGVAMNKWNSGAAIEDAVREQLVVEAAIIASQGHGLDPASIGHFMPAQIEAARIVQSGLVLRWVQEKHAAFAAPPDLATSIRPELDRLTPALLAALQPALSALRRDGLDALITVSHAVPATLGPALAVAVAPVIEAVRKVP